jgi:maltooligosyltrehalose trehalohydrolase
MTWQLPIGAQLQDDGVHFRVWAPDRRQVEVAVLDDHDHEVGRHPLTRAADGYFAGAVPGLGAGSRYLYVLDGEVRRPDPASRYQPEGVHGPSAVVDPGFAWTDQGWQGRPLEEIILYEVHIGTATPDGTFESFIERLPYLQALGVTTIEIMPVADFPGTRNWGYDGVSLFAPARAYGGPDGLKRLVDAAHSQGLAVFQDVVYNHLGPDGNYLRDFSPHYFTSGEQTPWGEAIDFTRPEVRAFVIANALYWAHEYHVDGLRLDATHALLEAGRKQMLRELTEQVRANLPAGRNFVLCAEDDRNDTWLITPSARGGAGMDAIWADDFHHEIQVAVAGDNEGYFVDYTGSAADVAATLRQGWFYTGQRSEFRGRNRGTDPSAFDPPHFIYSIQNHDQIGNRAFGERLSAYVGRATYRAVSCLLLLSPYTPLLFQGQEWAAETPFLFFTDHEPALGELVTTGRRKEFAHFVAFQGPEIPDPQASSSFEASKLRWDEIEDLPHTQTLDLYRELLSLRQSLPAFRDRTRAHWDSTALDDNTVALRYSSPTGQDDLLLVVNLKDALHVTLNEDTLTTPPTGYRWQVLLSSDDIRFGGPHSLTDLQMAVDAAGLAAGHPVAVALQAVPEAGGAQ